MGIRAQRILCEKLTGSIVKADEMSQTKRSRPRTDKQDARVGALGQKRVKGLKQENRRRDVDARRAHHVLGADLLDRQPVGRDAGIGNNHVDVVESVLLLKGLCGISSVGLALAVNLDHDQVVAVGGLALLNQLLGRGRVEIPHAGNDLGVWAG